MIAPAIAAPLAFLVASWAADGASFGEIPNGIDAFATSPDSRMVALLTEQGPIFLRVRVEIDGRDLDGIWRDMIARRFVEWDRNGDGKISLEEGDPKSLVGRIGDLASLFNRPANQQGPLAFPTKGIAGVDEMVAFFSKGEPSLRSKAGDPPDGRIEKLFEQLDTDRDKALGSDERAAARNLLGLFDRDEDGLLSLDELVPYGNPLAQQFGRQMRAGNSGIPTPLAFPLDSEERRRSCAEKWIQNRKESPVDKEAFCWGVDAFRGLDRDGNGRLSASELAPFLENPPANLIVTARLGKVAEGLAAIDAKLTDEPAPIPFALQRSSPYSYSLRSKALLIDLTVQQPGQGFDIRTAYDQQFAFADMDNNGYLDAQESRATGFFRDNLFRQIDRDNDGKLFKEEMHKFFDQHQQAADSCGELQSAEHGRILFASADADGDLALSERELRRMEAIFDSWDGDGDGRISEEEVPLKLELSFSRAQIDFPGMIQFGAQVQSRTAGIKPESSSGPLWFRRMDRNRDGDLSLPEFLGPVETFRRIDKDSDDLISESEASEARP